MERPSDSPVDLYLTGAGVSFPHHLTIQTIETLTQCRRICTNLPPQRLVGLPEDLLGKCTSLWPLYEDGRLRRSNYLDVTHAILSAVEAERPVAWLTPGHPVVFDSVTQLLLREGRAKGWRVEVLPAISSIDTLLAELEYDPASGLLVHEATSLVMRGVPLIASIATMLLQPAAFLSDRAQLTLPRAEVDLSKLAEYVLRYYPAGHRCAFVRSGDGSGNGLNMTWCRIDEINAVPIDQVAGSTLFIPRVG